MHGKCKMKRTEHQKSLQKYQQNHLQKLFLLSAAATALSASDEKVAKVHSQLSAERGLQKAESALLQLFFLMLKMLIYLHWLLMTFTDVTLVKMTLLMLLWSVRILSGLRLTRSSWLPKVQNFVTLLEAGGDKCQK